PYPINEYRVLIPKDLVLSRTKISSNIGTHAIRTELKWSKGTVTEHFVGDLFAGVDCGARCKIDQQKKTIEVL
ncbi:MAG: hypothetical protein CFE44_14340, partial [Burkholderiales bacterium PBB4]